MKTYFLLMEEARTRILTINYVYRNEGKLPKIFVREICYLQFRMLCEIIAIGCLVVHGDMPATQSLRKAYKPREIMDKLERLNPYFYPQPVEVTTTKDGGTHIAGQPQLAILTKAELPTLWGKCGDVLHHAPMARAIELARIAAHSDFADVFEWGRKLSNLLNSHFMVLRNGKKCLLVRLAMRDTGRAEVRVFEYPGDGTVSTWATKVSS